MNTTQALRQAAMPLCGQDGCEQPWLRVEWRGVLNADGDTVYLATAVCEVGHRVPVDPVETGD